MGTPPTTKETISGKLAYLWEIPNKPVCVYLRLDAIDRMSPEILRGLGALKRRGAEVGGLLLGTVEPGSPKKVTIVDFEPVPSEYLTGPSYNLSPNDLAAFEAAIARRRAERGLSVVGFYRSHTRDGLFMADADLALAYGYFREPSNVFLLIKPFATRASIGGFFIWEDGEICSQATYQQFPFSRYELGGGEVHAVPVQESAPALSPSLYRPEPDAATKNAPAVLPEPDPSSTILDANLSILSYEDESASRRAEWRWMLVPAFICVAVIATYFGYRSLIDSSNRANSQATAQTALPLKLSVAEKKDQLDVTWDRNAPGIAQSKRGVLSISDGASQRELELSNTQLKNGRVLYSRLSGDVMLRLEVFPEGQESISESVRIVLTEPVHPKPAAQAAEPSIPTPEAVSEAPPPAQETAPAKKTPPLVSRARARTIAPKPSPETVPEAPAEQPAVPAPPPEIELQRPERRR